MNDFTRYIIFINVFTFIIFGIDKYRAIKDKYRISESTLLLSSLIGGSFGAFIAMYFFRHKTKKVLFKICIPIMLVIHIIIIYFMK